MSNEVDSRAALVLQLTEAQLAKEVWAKLVEDPAVMQQIREAFVAGFKPELRTSWRTGNDKTPTEHVANEALRAAVQDPDIQTLLRKEAQRQVEAAVPALVESVVQRLISIAR